MKVRFIFLVAALFFSSSAFSQNKVTKDLIGTWAGTDSTNKIGTLQFINSDSVVDEIHGWVTINSAYNIELENIAIIFDIIVQTNATVIK